MNWYLVIKFIHILAVAFTVGGMFARQLVRGIARRSDDVGTVASLTRAAIRIDRLMVILWSSIMLIVWIILALLSKWPIFGLLQGAGQNWLLVSNILLVIMLALMPAVFVPHNKKSRSPVTSRLGGWGTHTERKTSPFLSGRVSHAGAEAGVAGVGNLRAPAGSDKIVLGLNPYNSRGFSAQIAVADYRKPPMYYYCYFK